MQQGADGEVGGGGSTLTEPVQETGRVDSTEASGAGTDVRQSCVSNGWARVTESVMKDGSALFWPLRGSTEDLGVAMGSLGRQNGGRAAGR